MKLFLAQARTAGEDMALKRACGPRSGRGYLGFLFLERFRVVRLTDSVAGVCSRATGVTNYR